MNLKRLVMVLPVMLTIILVGCSDTSSESIATVNGEEITKEELTTKLTQQYGTEVLDVLITNKIIELEAKELNVTVSEKDMEAEYVEYTDLYGGEDELKEVIATYNMSTEDIKKDIEIYLLTLKVMEDYVAITDKDVEAYFNDNIDLFTEAETETEAETNTDKEAVEEKAAEAEVPVYEDVKAEAYDMLLEERVNEQYATWVAEKMEEYDVTTTLYK